MRWTESDADCKGDDELLQLSIISLFPPFFSLTPCCRWTGVDWMRSLFPGRSSLGWQGKAIMEGGWTDVVAPMQPPMHPCIPRKTPTKCISYYLMRSLTSSSRCSSKLHHLISAAVWHEPPLQCVCPAIYWFPRSPQNPNRPTTHCILEKWFTMRWITATASFYAIFTPIEGQKQVFYSRWYSFHILVVYTLSSKQTTVDSWKMAHHHHEQQHHHNHF